jgi:hypothetical protein
MIFAASNRAIPIRFDRASYIAIFRSVSLFAQSEHYRELPEHIPTGLWFVLIDFTALLYYISSCISFSTYILPYYSDFTRFASYSFAPLRAALRSYSIFIPIYFPHFGFLQYSPSMQNLIQHYYSAYFAFLLVLALFLFSLFGTSSRPILNTLYSFSHMVHPYYYIISISLSHLFHQYFRFYHILSFYVPVPGTSLLENTTYTCFR